MSRRARPRGSAHTSRPNRVALDSGVLSAWAAGDANVRALLRSFAGHEVDVILPSVVLSETTTGTRRDPAVLRVVRGTAPVSADVDVCRRAGELRHHATRRESGGRSVTLDALIAASAEAGSADVLLTYDVDDFAALGAAGLKLRVERP